MQAFVNQHGNNFYQAVQQRQYAFGKSQGGQINDLANALVAASFLSQAGAQDYQGFVVPAGLDLSRSVEHGNAVLFAWTQDFSPVKAMNQFTPKRGFKHTLWRVPVPISPQL